MAVSQWVLDAMLGVALALLHARVLLPRQPEPAPGTPGAEVKPRYAVLASWPFALFCAGLAAGCQFAGQLGSEPMRPLWIVWGSSVLVLVAVDARSTWLPRRLTWLCLAQLAAAVFLVTLLTGDLAVLRNAAAGALLLSGPFWLLWRLGAGIGFGDVRLALGLGGLAGAVSMQFWFLAVLSAGLAGGLWGLVHGAVHGRHRPFAYAPALWLGPLLAQSWALTG